MPGNATPKYWAEPVAGRTISTSELVMQECLDQPLGYAQTRLPLIVFILHSLLMLGERVTRLRSKGSLERSTYVIRLILLIVSVLAAIPDSIKSGTTAFELEKH